MSELIKSKPLTFADFEHQGWEELSSAYDESWGHVTSAFVPAILNGLKNIKGSHLIDIATGPGYAASRAAERGAFVTGVDFAASMIEAARKSVPGAKFHIADVEALPFDDAVVDCAISNFGFQHFENPTCALEEIARVLKPNGTLCFTIWADSNQNSASLILEKALARFSINSCPVPEGPSYGFLWNASLLSQTFVGAGYEASSVQSKLHVIPWRLNDPDELFRAELAGSVRSGAVLRQQPDDTREKIRAAMEEDILEHYNEQGTLIIPMAAYVICANKL